MLARFVAVVVAWTALTSFANAATASSQDFFAALGNSQAIQGSQRNAGPFTIQVLSNETHAIVTMNATTKAASAVGYMAVGFGSSMASSDMVIAWPKSDGSWTISPRQTSGHVQPQPVSTTLASTFTLLPTLSSSTLTETAYVTFLRPLALPSGFKTTSLARSSGQVMVYAASASNPASNNGQISQHPDGAYGTTSIDLSVAIATGNTGSGSSNGGSSSAQPVVAQASGDSNPWTRYDSIIVLHALCGSLAWLIVSPAAVLIGRLARSFDGWMRLHQLLQTVLTTSLTVAAVILGAVATNTNAGAHFVSAHARIGLIMAVLVVIQVSLGYFSHARFNPSRTHRPPSNVAHILIGVSLIILGYIQVDFGLKLYKRAAPGYVWAAYFLSVAGFGLSYLVSCLRLVQTRRQEGKPWSHAAAGLGRVDEKQLSSLPGSRSGSRAEKNPMSFFDQPVPDDDFGAAAGAGIGQQPTHSQVAAREWAEATHERMQAVRPPASSSSPSKPAPYAFSGPNAGLGSNTMPSRQPPRGSPPRPQQGQQFLQTHPYMLPAQPAAWQSFGGETSRDDLARQAPPLVPSRPWDGGMAR